MSTKPIPAPDWFEAFWQTHKHKLPVYLRSDATKELARTMLSASIQSAAQFATTPEGVRALISFSRIAAIVKGTRGVCDAPDPSPEEVAAAVERLVARVKP